MATSSGVMPYVLLPEKLIPCYILAQKRLFVKENEG